MEKNIFEGAKFGDKFLTRDDRKAIMLSVDYSDKYYALSVEDDTNHYYHLYNSDGSVQIVWKFDEGSFLDIVSRYQEPIDFKKFDYSGKMVKYAEQYAKDNFEDNDVIDSYDIEEAYLAGYRKAMEE